MVDAHRPTVLIVSNEQDVSVDWVVRLLRERDVPALRLNTERSLDWQVVACPLSGAVKLTVPPRGDVDLSDLRSIWYRRPEPPALVSEATDAENAVIRQQWRSVIEGLCNLPGLVVVNHPSASTRAESKLWQLREAQAVGFDVPRTLITNVASEARRFAGENAPVVVKALDAPFVDEPERPRFMFTTRVDRALLERMAAHEAAPLLFQAEVQNKLDVRVTVVGSDVFAAQTTSGEEVDWRAATDKPPFRLHDLPPDVAELCRALTRRMGLSFAGIDLLLDREGRYFFLESNPNGEWGWLQKTVPLPIAEALVRLLAG